MVSLFHCLPLVNALCFQLALSVDWKNNGPLCHVVISFCQKNNLFALYTFCHLKRLWQIFVSFLTKKFSTYCTFWHSHSLVQASSLLPLIVFKIDVSFGLNISFLNGVNCKLSQLSVGSWVNTWLLTRVLFLMILKWLVFVYHLSLYTLFCLWFLSKTDACSCIISPCTILLVTSPHIHVSWFPFTNWLTLLFNMTSEIK